MFRPQLDSDLPSPSTCLFLFLTFSLLTRCCQAAFVREMSKYCDAVVVVTAFMDPHNTGSDEVWQKNTELLLKLTPGIPLGLYECPVPYKRLLSPKLLAWCAQTGRFLFHKVGRLLGRFVCCLFDWVIRRLVG